jgi:hypothetical protein
MLHTKHQYTGMFIHKAHKVFRMLVYKKLAQSVVSDYRLDNRSLIPSKGKGFFL